MKTIRIPDRLYSKLLLKAKTEGCTVDSLVAREIEAGLFVRHVRARRRVKPPIIHSKQPGTLFLDNDRIFELIPFP